ncbi:iron complex transport system substrate-binding protein [Halarchaeum rubridurum]|uniref:Iron complex transport system substrate-binding protein n=1 Tax=Halarchaeum rubridurum TaxID=489911 RepID=A0A830FYS3_9EURY|nr:ABC transporter substrate-binding protein [Halarchaeum rubridurum]MBP1954484.1 iron complex transport system substrate-binding protein [Halarchaeum rubridurum]GGM61400.1 hypothetical protein GCM10009017_09400 [Halarchaeum rubridurum]
MPSDEPTRRDYLTYGGLALGSGLLAGCAGTGGEETTTSSTETTSTSTTTSEDTSYTVTMSPMGEVEFDAVPTRVLAGQPNTVDMAVAAGKADALDAAFYPQYNGTVLDHFYAHLDGVSLDADSLTDSWNMGLEGYYELDSDVHLVDPAYASTLQHLDANDVADVRTDIGPWFGNYYSGSHSEPPEQWADGYEYYTLWQVFERVARVFDARENYRALKAEHDAIRETIEADLPSEDERPTVSLVFPGQDGTLWVYHLNAPGFLCAHTRPLAADDAFGDADWAGSTTQVDYEAMLDRDPDVLLVLFTMASSYSIADVRSALEDDPVASEIAAVRNDRVYAQGVRYQGPIANLFQLEMTAKQLYPDAFGAWPGYTDGADYPEIPEDERLFDRGAVADAIAGGN